MDQDFNPYIAPSGGEQRNNFKVNQKPNYFEHFAFAFAIASFLSCTVIYTAYLFGGLAILFALLSRGAQMQFSPKAKKSIIMGVCGIILSTVIFVATFLYLLEEFGSVEGIIREGSDMLGIDFEKEFGYLFE